MPSWSPEDDQRATVCGPGVAWPCIELDRRDSSVDCRGKLDADRDWIIVVQAGTAGVDPAGNRLTGVPLGGGATVVKVQVFGVAIDVPPALLALTSALYVTPGVKSASGVKVAVRVEAL